MMVMEVPLVIHEELQHELIVNLLPVNIKLSLFLLFNYQCDQIIEYRSAYPTQLSFADAHIVSCSLLLI